MISAVDGTAFDKLPESFDADGKNTIAVMPQDDLAYSVTMQGIYKAILLESYSVSGAHGARIILDSEGQAMVVKLEDGSEQ